MKHPLARILLFGFVILAMVWGDQTLAAAGLKQEQTLSADILTAGLSMVYNWTYAGGSEGVEFGYAVHTAGDINGDGYADILIGAPKYSYTPGVDRDGATFVFYGGPFGLSIAPDWVMGGGLKGSRFGHAVSTAGDVNGDGYDDVIIGANDYKVAFDLSGEPKSGAVFVYHGSVDGLSLTPDWSVLAEAPEIALGRAVSTAGDVNNDGYDDVIVSAPLYGSSPEQGSEGKIYLYLGGGSGLSLTSAWSYECNRSTALCGDSLDAAGDVNHDGYDDIIIGAPFWDGTFSNEGLALVFFGCQAGLSLEPGWALAGGQEGAQFGRAVAGAGNVNGDIFDDILVGASYYTKQIALPQAGAAFLFFGSPTGPSLVYDWATYGEEAYARYGHALHRAGDVDQDGYGDVIIGSHLLGANGDINHQPDEGGAYVFNGGPGGLETTPSWTTYGDKAEAWYGYSVGSAGDVDGDLADDVIIGTPNYRIDENTIMGKAFGYYSQGDGRPFSVYLPVIITR